MENFCDIILWRILSDVIWLRNQIDVTIIILKVLLRYIYFLRPQIGQITKGLFIQNANTAWRRWSK